MFEKFSPDARAAVVRAREETVRAGQREVGPEHLLVALAAGPGLAADALAAAGATEAGLRGRLTHQAADEPDPLDADALASIGIDLDAVRRASDAAFGDGALDRPYRQRPGRRGVTTGLRMTRPAKRALELGLRSAARRGDRSISSGHLLLGVLDLGDGPALSSLAAVSVDPARLRDDTTRRMTAAA
jgi:ATP-dependent Clp protease ATP-binding subunit ClpA